MGLFGSLIKTVIKAPLVIAAPVADYLTVGAFGMEGDFLTERAAKSFAKEVKKVSKGLGKL